MDITKSSSLLSMQLDAAAGGQKNSKLHSAAQEFEALMIGEMLKTTREAGDGGWLGGGQSTGDDAAIGMAESEFSKALALGGGLGLSKTIERELSRPAGTQNVAASPGKVSASSEK